MITKTTETGPVHLGLPAPEPVPVDDCDVCAVLARNRKKARRNGDLSKVTDLTIEMRTHQGSGCA